MEKLINLTPHEINIRLSDGTITIPSKGNARVANLPGKQIGLATPDAIPVFEKDSPGEVEGLPSPQTGVMYIVSIVVASALPERKDLLVPGTGPKDGCIRENGKIVAVTKLKRA